MIVDNTRYIGLITTIFIVISFIPIVVIAFVLFNVKHDSKRNSKDDKETIHKLKTILKVLLVVFVFSILINTIWSWEHPTIGVNLRN